MSRVLAAVALLVGLFILQAIAGPLFPVIVSVALIAAPAINWRAWAKLHRQHLARPAIQSLRSATHTALLLAIASSIIALVGLFIAARAFNIVPAVPRELFLVGLAYPLLLMTGPAIEWLRFRVWSDHEPIVAPSEPGS